ncbi:MAG: type II toxin-antitoxin system HicA family toxin [Thiotrichales bacterium]|jgi:hypothetical protein|nr:type II toxin-antitoxin system HicA family toxin [Thiotrichales bacterium]MBT3612820.1 type II toxin-antitoxin system HicA family toxin [Thiotrichales bacterium]MBT3751878.1 type II toxin-antitoxin system HicA family toxin [Thiotrichales bacterium]MBT3837246.1 type II toxin-antitoxin system HicA family toxin [Thiotrichales bacterium]MBT4152266.1 type II toxin-antitoxin system HicA family toxin [Thiotrichales bacterium]
MNSKQKKIFKAIFTDPINGNLEWRKIESLLKSLDAEVVEGSGSRVTFLLNGCRKDFHRPHPSKEALRYRVIDVRELLNDAGVKL